jgi:hypothetical protein
MQSEQSVTPIKNFKSIIYYLGLRVERDKQTRIIYFTQTVHIDRIFEEAEIQNYKSANIFINSKLQLYKNYEKLRNH